MGSSTNVVSAELAGEPTLKPTLCHQLSITTRLLGLKFESGGRVVLVEVEELVELILLLVELVEVVRLTVVEVDVELVDRLVEVDIDVLVEDVEVD